jgi:AcrR family transcriptional regulator
MNAMSSEKRRYELKARAEAQRETRERIVRATMALHEEVGPAQTTIAEIARRAGVQRLTVYNHFPDEAELFGACQAHWLSLHPPPDVDAAFARTDPVERVATVLGAFYAWYRETAAMAEKIQRDRDAVPALDTVMQQTGDAALADLAAGLAAGFGGADDGRTRRPMIRLALDLWTWRRLTLEGLDDGEAAAVMAAAVESAGK